MIETVYMSGAFIRNDEVGTRIAPVMGFLILMTRTQQHEVLRSLAANRRMCAYVFSYIQEHYPSLVPADFEEYSFLISNPEEDSEEYAEIVEKIRQRESAGTSGSAAIDVTGFELGLTSTIGSGDHTLN